MHWQLFENLWDAIRNRDYLLIAAFINSTIITVASVTIMVVLSAMVAYVLQRRPSRWTKVVDVLILCGLIIPPAIVPTVYVLQKLALFKTLQGLILVEVASGCRSASCCSGRSSRRSRASSTRPRSSTAPVRCGCSSSVIFPLLRSVTITVIVDPVGVRVQRLHNPLYFLPGDENATVQLTLFNFQSQFNTQYNLLFADILLITIPPLIMFMFFNRKIVAGLTSGAVKG